jgi:Mn2+/Fe2+ NRAMP family transporter
MRVRSLYRVRLLTYLMVMGPGLIMIEADNDADAVATYVEAGRTGLHLLRVLLILRPVTYFEMVAWLEIATGKGHAAMIYLRFGPRSVCCRCAIRTSSTL